MLRKVTFALFLLASEFFLAEGPAHAVTRDLKTAELRKSDVPSGFVGPRIRVYSRFRTEMKVALTHTATSSSSSGCTLPADFKKDGWRRGLVEVFSNSRGEIALIGVCVSQFSTAGGAHLAFHSLARQVTTQLGSVKSSGLKVKIHTTPTLGNESLTVVVGGSGGSLDAGQFRRDDVVVQTYYQGSQLTYSQFSQLLALSNSRLQ